MKILLFISMPPVVHTQYVTSDEAAGLLNVNIRTVRIWARTGKLHAYRYGHRIFFKSLEIIKVITQ